MKATSKAVKKSRQAAGKRSTSFYWSDAERAEVAALADRLSVSQSEAILTAVRSFGRSELSDADLMALLRARLER